VTPVRPRRERESHLDVVLRWGQLQCGHALCGSPACRGAWMRAATLSGAAGRVQSPGACSRAATVCENRRFAPSWPGCVLCGSLGSRAGRCPSDWSHAPALSRNVRQSAVATPRSARLPSGSRAQGGPWYPPCARSPRRPGNGGPGQPAQSPPGGVNAALSATVGRPCVLREAWWRRCAATAPSTPKTDRCPSRGTCPTSQSRCGR
jgi:hypothetical protein